MCPGAVGGGFFRSEEKWEVCGTRIHSQWNRQSLGFLKRNVTSQITLKLEGISVEDMTDGDSMFMK